jgi:hypothetical protein
MGRSKSELRKFALVCAIRPRVRHHSVCVREVFRRDGKLIDLLGARDDLRQPLPLDCRRDPVVDSHRRSGHITGGLLEV